MRRSVAASVVGFTLALSGAMTASPAGAVVPQTLTINVHRDGGDTWSSTGAFSDSGSFVDAPGVPDSFAGASSTFHVVRTFTGAQGTFLARADVRITATSDSNVLAVTGRWVILSGTGAYADMSGAGSVSESFDTSAGVIQGTWLGRVLL
jgi:hypothetical protein